MKNWFRPLFLAGLFFTSQIYVRAADFTAQGSGYVTIGRISGKQKTNACAVTIEVRGKEYRIAATSFSDVEVDNQVLSSDGTFNYRLSQTWPSLKDKLANTNYSEYGEIRAGVFPYGARHLTRMIWWAYYAPSLLKPGTNDLKIPSESAPIKYHDRFQVASFSPSNPMLLDEVSCYADNTARMQKKDQSTNVVLKAPFDHDWLHWHLKITGSTNLGKITVPLSFDYEGYVTDDRAATNRAYLEPPFRAHFTMTNFSLTVPAGSLLPVANLKHVPVMDWTHFPTDEKGGSPVVGSTLTGNDWQSPTNAHTLKQVREIQKVLDQQKHR